MTQHCLEKTCGVSDILTVGKVQAEACNSPLNSKKAELMAPLAIELLGIPAVLLRLYSRWRYTAGYDIDDWIMVACLPIFIVFEVVGHVCSSPFTPLLLPVHALAARKRQTKLTASSQLANWVSAWTYGW